MRQQNGQPQALKRLWVTGASGLLGSALCAQCAEWDVLGLWNVHAVPGTKANSARVDLTDYRAVKALLHDQPPAAVIHCAAVSDPGACERDSGSTRRINVDAVLGLAGLCADRAVPFVFTSTDLVFDGTRAPYREEDPVNPLSHYAEQKVRAEIGALEKHPGAVVCRLPLLFGFRAGQAAGALRGIVGAPPGAEARLFTDEYRTPVSAAAAASGILAALRLQRGILHLGGSERISRYEFGCLASDVFGTKAARLVPCRQKDMNLQPRRPPDVSLDSTKARQLGYAPPALEEQLRAVWKEEQGR